MSERKTTDSGINPNFLPFVRNDKWNIYEQFKLVVGGLILVPIRIIASLVLVSWYFVVVHFGLIGVNDLSKPIPKWRRDWFVNSWQIMARNLLWIMGFYYVPIKGSNRLKGDKGQANIIVMNHTSWLDIFVMMGVADGIPGFVAKAEVKNIPLIGYLSQAWQGVFVSTRVGHTGESVATQIAQRGVELDKAPILCFPEGTTSNGRYLIQFKTGAFIGGHPVKPVVIRYPYKNFSPTYESIKGIPHILRLFAQFRNHCEVEFLPVYYPNEAEKKDPKLFADNVRQVMAKALQVPVSDATFQDKLAYHEGLWGKKNKSGEAKKQE